MKCPVDGETLAMSERQGIEVDYCPECRGIWLDRGELDKILERTREDETQFGFDGEHTNDHHHKEKKRKNRLSVLSDLLGGGED